MKTANFIIFFGFFFFIYGLTNFYIFIRGWQAIPAGSTLRSAYAIVFWILALSFIGGRFLERVRVSAASDLLVWMGSFWIGAMLYFFIAVVFFDILRLVDNFVPLFPSFIALSYDQVKYVTAASTIGLVGALLLAGHINALVPRVRNLDISIDKPAQGMKQLKIVAASDVHLGTLVGRHRFDEIVNSIRALEPDLVLLPGDIVDEDLAPVIKQNLGGTLDNLKPRLGVFAVTGNHEYIGGVEEACEYLSKHGVTVLRDRAVKVNGSFYLVGREDRSRGPFTGRPRKDLTELLRDVDRKCPIILMDHQPFQLEQAVSEKIDLQLSGHTHQGQLWPVNYIIKAIYELGWGYRKTGATHFYVSSGVGTWGPPVRIGHRPELVNIRVTFK